MMLKLKNTHARAALGVARVHAVEHQRVGVSAAPPNAAPLLMPGA